MAETIIIWHIPVREWNAAIKAENGNGRNSLCVLHWNMGSRHWRRKTDDIVQILSVRNPDLFLVSEANLQVGTPIEESCIEGYSPILKNGAARLVVLVKDGIQVKVRLD